MRNKVIAQQKPDLDEEFYDDPGHSGPELDHTLQIVYRYYGVIGKWLPDSISVDNQVVVIVKK